MIVDSDLAVNTLKSRAAVSTIESEAMSLRWTVGVFLLFLCLTVALQLASGAYSSEFSGYPDEPAHYVTSVMVYDYVRHFHFESPLRFAQEYYDHYPKVAFGHWPPLLYILQATWMLVFSPSRASIRLESAFTAAALAFSVAFVLRRHFNRVSALLGGSLLLCLPLVQTYTSEEMAELLLTLTCFWSAIFFSRYLETGTLRHSLLFGIFFAAAVLTKGNGWLLAIIPPVAMLLSGKISYLRRPAFWASAALVAVTCIPWQLLTMRMAERGWDGGSKPSLAYTSMALAEFLPLFVSILGPVLFIVCLVGVFVALKPVVRLAVAPLAASLLALALGVWIFHSVVPAGVEDRKLIIAVPAMIYFLVTGVWALARWIPVSKFPVFQRATALAVLLTLVFVFQVFEIPKVTHYGFDRAAHYIAAHPDLEESNILVSSSSVGEGLLLSELAMVHPDPRGHIIRATKALATVDWTGSRYQCLVHSVPELTRYLRQHNIQVVVVDVFPPTVKFQHDTLLRKAVADSTQFTRVASFPSKSQSGSIEIYRLAS